MNEKEKVARLSIFSNSFLILIKLFAAILGGSVGILSEAIHSAVDLVASFVAFIAVRISSKPPDKQHPYGHGKYENVSGVIEALLIFLAAIWIIYEAIHRLIQPSEIKYALLGFIVMGISAIVNYYVSRKLYKTAKKYDSIALESDALHLKTDIYTSLGVALGFIIIYFTDLHWIDSAIAIGVAFIILYESYVLLNQAFSPLVDSQLPIELQNNIIQILEIEIKKFEKVSYKALRTRKSGALKHLDFILQVPGEISVTDAHHLCDDIEEKIHQQISNIDINIHIEPHSEYSND